MSTRWLEVAAIFAEARERRRGGEWWLEYEEWDRVFGIWQDMGSPAGPEVGVPAFLAASMANTHQRIQRARADGRAAKDEHYRHEWETTTKREQQAKREAERQKRT